jgi:outer membrane protein assembly factor BamB
MWTLFPYTTLFRSQRSSGAVADSVGAVLRGARFVPASVLVALAVALATRRGHRARPPAPAGTGTATAAVTATTSAPSIASWGDAGALTDHAARTLHEDAHRTHRAHAVGPTAAKLSWSHDVGGAVEAQVVTSPDEQTLYVASLGGSLTALDREGKVRWTLALGDRVYGTPLVDADGNLYVGSDAKIFYAVSKTGGVKWKLEVDGEADTSAVLDGKGRIVFGAGRTLYAVTSDGTAVWRFAAGGKIFSSPAVTDGGLVVFGSQDGHLYGVDEAGKQAFRTDLGGDVDASPATVGSAIYVGSDRGEVVRVDDKGQIVWRVPVGGFVRGALSIARSGDVLAGVYGPVPRVVRVTADGTLAASFPIQGTGAAEFGVHGAPLEDDAHSLYFGAQDDALYAVGQDGAILFRFETGGDVDAPATLLSDGSLVFASDDGKVYYLAR